VTILEWILLILGIITGIITVIPILAFLCVKWGVAGFYQGKEAIRRRIDVTTSDKKRKTEKF